MSRTPLYVALLLATSCTTDQYLSKSGDPEDFVPILIVSEFVAQNNDGKEMTILTPKAQEVFNTVEEWGVGRTMFSSTTNLIRYGNVIFTKFRAHPPPRFDEGWTYEGWLALEVENGKVDFVAMAGQKQGATHNAEAGQSADLATTAVGLSQGLTEANPIFTSGGIPMMAVAKLGTTQILKNYSLESCVTASPLLASFGWGAAAWNVAAIAGLGPAGAIPAVLISMVTFTDSNDAFWERVPPAVYKDMT